MMGLAIVDCSSALRTIPILAVLTKEVEESVMFVTYVWRDLVSCARL